MRKNFVEVKGIKQLFKTFGLSEEEARKVKMRRNLFVAIKKHIQKNKWTHQKTALKAKVGRTVITAIMNGNLDNISTDKLIDIAQKIGLTVTLKVA